MAIAADIEAQVSLMGPRFQFQFLRASEALTAIAAQPSTALRAWPLGRAPRTMTPHPSSP